ncbi:MULTISPECIES: hybrid sensor histidine kinase/response regulator [unclassified Leptolyngbya]|uniref:hybrid sensor histidine kinase/response regulator n=1 Tax=unclassified Leptolyngbya TaxID=2650499 RepID=UPI001689F5CC|nr:MULTISPECIES: hybrid sensor histidine kinase/response regulator [unclassified Leptolyngbya]MBD1909262.1 response regulator [Leptolyngbya sp. FACHB-8]MBD2154315.1 response regulator [Leptolyngbya sp. FACHB-16]
MSNIWTLLITDDCQEDREVYREYLSGDPEQSYQFIEAGSAEVGLALCQKQHCDAILLDFSLPDMTGLEFLDELYQQAGVPLPVIMVTGQGDERVAVQAMKRGAQDYLIKQDLEPNVLQVTVRNAVQQSRQRNQFSQTSKPRQLTAEVALHLHRSLDLEEILHTAVTEVQQVLECDRVVIYRVIPNPDNTSAYGTSPQILSKRCETRPRSDQAPDPIEALSSFLTDAYLLDGKATQTTAAPEIGVATVLRLEEHEGPYLIAPILLPAHVSDSLSTVWGLLVAQTSARQWQNDEADFLGELANQLAIALQQSEQLAQVLQALEAEKQLSALKSQLVATVSHEYRSPLSVILTAASTLKLHRSKLPEAKQQQFLQMIETKARQMTQLVDDLLVLETFESGKVNFAPQPFELLQFISDVIDDQRQTNGEHYPLSFRITGNTRGFFGDHKLLRLILVNLLSNAIKYSPDGREVEVHLTGNDTHIWIEVKDQGIGIPMENHDQVLQAFNRGSNVGMIPGTGLGLAIVKACVDLHNGEITFQSQEGKGTQFTICLPKRTKLIQSEY